MTYNFKAVVTVSHTALNQSGLNPKRNKSLLTVCANNCSPSLAESAADNKSERWQKRGKKVNQFVATLHQARLLQTRSDKVNRKSRHKCGVSLLFIYTHLVIIYRGQRQQQSIVRLKFTLACYWSWWWKLASGQSVASVSEADVSTDGANWELSPPFLGALNR